MKLQVAYSFLNREIEAVEAELEKIVLSEQEILSSVSLKLLQSGGKRIRPVFVLLSGQFGERNHNGINNAAIALELIHMASLVHDDVIDDADKRRGVETVNAVWGSKVAMYTGDYLFARALTAMAEIENPKAHKVLAETILELCRGEIEQIKDKYNYNQGLRCYLRRIKRKTALLIASSCQIGAIAANASEEVQQILYQYGYYVGMSYQIIDDILDFVATEEQLGKPAGGDLLQGNITLPVLFAMEDEELKRRIIEVNESTTKAEIEALIKSIKETDAIERAFSISASYLQRALDVIKPLPRGQAKMALYSIAKYIGKRKF